MENLITENLSSLYKAVHFVKLNKNDEAVVNPANKIDTKLKNIQSSISEKLIEEIDYLKSENDHLLSENLFTGNEPTSLLRPSKETTSLQKAKNTFMYATIGEGMDNLPLKAANQPMAVERKSVKESILSKSDDSRATGGGNMNNMATRIKEVTPSLKRRHIEGQCGRKISFKVKNASSSYRRTTISNPKATVTINSNKVSELTRKFNEMVKEENSILHHPKFAKTVEKIQNNIMYKDSTSNSSTLSSNTNIKYLLKNKHSDRRRRLKKRCSSFDDIGQVSSRESILNKKVRRAISDNAHKKNGRRRLRHNSKSSNTHSEKSLDTVDGLDTLQHVEDEKKSTASDMSSLPSRQIGNVKEAIKKFETSIIDINTSTKNDVKYAQVIKQDKPKLPEKKSFLTVTKNVVLKDGKPKIKTLKSSAANESQEIKTEYKLKQDLIESNEIIKKVRTESLYEKFKFKTNFTHGNKLRVVEIEQDETDETSNVLPIQRDDTNMTPNILDIPEKINISENADTCMLKGDDTQEIEQNVTPNDSFLWRTSCQNFVKSETGETKIYEPISSMFQKNKSFEIEDNAMPITVMYTQVNKMMGKQIDTLDQSVSSEDKEDLPINIDAGIGDGSHNCTLVNNSDIEHQLDSTVNNFTTDLDDQERTVYFSIKSAFEDDYEPLEPFQVEAVNDVLDKQLTTNSSEKSSKLSKINCPLPEIPKITEPPSPQHDPHENIYQCLLEMRSHPEGDESSIHSYEFCDNNQLEERTRGDGDSDDGYEYCRSPHELLDTSPQLQLSKETSSENIKPLPPRRNAGMVTKRGSISSSFDSADPIYERVVPPRPPKLKNLSSLLIGDRDSFASCPSYNEGENIYDTIKHPASISNCYESIPNTPKGAVRLQNENRLGRDANKRLSFDTVSNLSHSTMSSEQKTNSIYGQRSIISYSGQEISFQVPNSETSVSDKSDRSDDWIDLSDQDEDKTNSKIVIVRDRGRGRKSPVSWAQKVRHQWTKSPAPAHRKHKPESDSSDSGHFYESLEGAPEPRAVTPIEEDFDSFDSDSECEEISSHDVPKSPIQHQQSRVERGVCGSDGDAIPPRLPPPPASTYTLTRFASAATKKMRQLKRNFTRRYTDALKPNSSSTQNDWDTKKTDHTCNVYQNVSFPQKTAPSSKGNVTPENIYHYNNIHETRTPNNGILTKTETIESPINGNAFINKSVLNNTNSIYSVTNVDNSAVEGRKLSSSNMESGKGKDSETLSRKAYLSFKSRFRRSSSTALDIDVGGGEAPHAGVPAALKIRNSTFYLTDSIDGDSGFSNCSDSVHLAIGGSSETLQPLAPTRRRNKKTESGSDITIFATNKQHPKYESSPNLTAYSSPGGEHGTGAYQSPHTPARLRSNPRPLAPPPPPPTDLTAINAELKKLLPSLAKRDKRRSRTSWYADCGTTGEESVTNGIKERTSGVSWYAGTDEQAEAGLYRADVYRAGASSSSSGASSASGSHHGLFMQEPLYQFYNAAKLESVCQEHSTDSDSEGYEEISSVRRKALEEAQPPSEAECLIAEEERALEDERGPRLPALELLSPRGPSRTLWCEIPEVIKSPVLSSLSPNQKKLQEAKFEVLTSEASYLNSLSVLEQHFMTHAAFKDEDVLNHTDREILFGSIMPVKRCSQHFMSELERCWQSDILLAGLCELVQRYAEKHFGPYIKYCENQVFLVKALHNLKRRPAFLSALATLEAHPACQSLSLHSFLMLPMQRVTRLPLLMDAVLQKLQPADREYRAAMDALATLNNFVTQCNEGARNMERKEELFRMSSQMEFPAHMSRHPELSVSCNVDASGKAKRWLVRSGELTQLVWRDDQLKLTFGKKFNKNPLWLFLFTDVLIIAKKKSEDAYLVVDYCQRSLIEMSSGDVMSQLHLKESPGKHTMLLTLLENHENKTVEMLMSCGSETDRQRWTSALASPRSCNPEETLYEGWDCPQVAAAFAYRPHQPDELALHEGDVVNVHKKMADGWYYGERIRDGEVGWFPGNYSKEIASAHVRARNLRQRYRLLALSGTYLGQKKKT